ncbi:hypothetical protein D9M69_282690 [compost metagenome]
MQGHDSRQAGDATDEGRQVVIATHHRNLDRQFDVELLGGFGQQLDLFEFETAAQAGTRDVFQQTRNLGITGQLPQQGTEGGFHLLHLLLVGFEVRGLERLRGKLILQGRLFGSLGIQLELKVLEVEVVSQCQHNDQQQQASDDLDRNGPGTEVVDVQVGKIDLAQAFEGVGETHFAAPVVAAAFLPFCSSEPGWVCCTVSWKTLA